MPAPRALVVLAPGFEEIEAATPIDVLRRAGVKVFVASVEAAEPEDPAGLDLDDTNLGAAEEGGSVTGARGLSYVVDGPLSVAPDEVDLIVLPGGMPGATNLAASQDLADRLRATYAAGGRVAAICAAPAVALAPSGLLSGRRATCYPGFEERFPADVTFAAERVVVDERITTSRGPGTALEFSLALVEQLVSAEQAAALREGMLVQS